MAMDSERASRLAREIMQRAEAAILTTIDEDGFPATRAMLNLRNRQRYPGLAKFFAGTRDILFTTNTSSRKVAQIAKDGRACAYFCLPSEWGGVAVQGMIAAVDDPAVRRALWQDDWTAYYPKGPDDPDHTVLRLTPTAVKGYHQLSFFTLAPDDLA
jgi:general stress protein 26